MPAAAALLAAARWAVGEIARVAPVALRPEALVWLAWRRPEVAAQEAQEAQVLQRVAAQAQVLQPEAEAAQVLQPVAAQAQVLRLGEAEAALALRLREVAAARIGL